MVESGFSEQKLREAEVQAFFEALQEAVREKQQRSAQLVSDFEKHWKKVSDPSRWMKIHSIPLHVFKSHIKAVLHRLH